jgi:hypothetical protein
MTNEKLVIEFVKFLVHEHVLKKYVNNFQNKNNTYQRKFNISSYHFLPQDLLARSFHWDETKEGFDFWIKMHNKWVIWLKNIQKQ